MSYKTVQDSSLTAVADAIREKGGTQAALTFPGDFVDAIGAISGGDDGALAGMIAREPADAEHAFIFPDGIKLIGTQAFAHYAQTGTKFPCTIPSTVTTISLEAFLYAGISKLTFERRITNVMERAFRYSRVEEADVNMSFVPEYCFANCTALTKIKFRGNLTSVNSAAFYNSSNCLVFDFSECTEVPALMGVNAFRSINANAQIIVPDNLYESWIAATNWADSSIVGHIVKESEAA